MAVKRDTRGHIIGKCRKRVHPIKQFRKTEFVARYRLSKKCVRELATKYAPHSNTKGEKKGGGLTHLDRVCFANFI